MTDPCIGPDGVFLNRLGITDPAELRAAEADITSARLIALNQLGIDGDYDLDHLRAFHRFVFADIYTWAGELRTVDIAKYDAFCRCATNTSPAKAELGSACCGLFRVPPLAAASGVRAWAAGSSPTRPPHASVPARRTP